MEIGINKSQLVSTLKGIEKIRSEGNSSDINRAGGFLEGILYTLGEIKPETDFDFKDIEYIEIGWFGQKKLKTRKQTYIEFMIEKMQNLIDKTL